MYYLIRGKDATFIRKALSASLLFISFFAFGQGNGGMACNELIQVSLDQQCEALIDPDMILEGTYPDYSIYTVSISGVVGDIVRQPGNYTVTVINTLNNNSCWGEINVEDKLPPIVEDCPCAEDNDDPECQFYCTDLTGILEGDIVVPTPIVNENCGTYTTLISDHVVDRGCDGKVIERTYRFTDQYGNQSLDCTTYLYLASLTLDDVTPPSKTVHLPCASGTDTEDIFNYFAPLVGPADALGRAYPTVNGEMIDNQGGCNIVATHTDSETLVCGDDCPKSKKVLRTWSLIDWCNDDSRDYVQIISSKDVEEPTIVVDDFTKSVNPWNCEADFYLPEPKILHDNCDDNPTYIVNGPLGSYITWDADKKRFRVTDVPKGIHNFYYRGIDCCGNEGVDTVVVSILDQSSPVAVAKEFVVVSLTKESGNDGIAKIYPQSIDNGSHDGCTDVHLEIRREGNECGHFGNLTYNDDGHSNDHHNDPDDGQFVKFCCEDLTDVSDDGVPYGRVKVWLRVWDDGDMDGHFGSAGDNYNETWSWVRVEDKLSPTITCPPDITIDCDEDYTNLDVTGRGVASFTCTNGMVEYEDDLDLNSCGFGTVRRKWYVKNNKNIFCYQYIYIDGDYYFNHNSIVWPKDETLDCKEVGEYEVTWTDAACSLIGISVESDTFQFVDDVCYKILNRYTLVDWCVYDPNYPNSGGMWYHTQVVKIIDEDAPIINCQDTMFAVGDPSDVDNDGITCELKNLMLTNSAYDEGDCSSNYLRWQVFVDVWGDGKTDYEYSSYLPSTDNKFNDTNNNGVPDIYVKPTKAHEEIKITLPDDIEGSMSNHKVTWKVTDGCGNHKSCTSIFMVVDKKKPTPYCISLSSAVMNDGTVELWARDFDQGSFDNCTAQEDLLFTFNRARPVANKINVEHYFKGDGLSATEAEYLAGEAQKWVPDFNSSAMVFDCDDIPSVEVEMTVWDEKGEYDFCVVSLTLVDNQGACGDGMRVGITGAVTNSSGVGMGDVKVTLYNNQVVGFPVSTQTNTEGEYTFADQPAYLDYIVSVEKDGDYLNGVSTLDLVLMQRHILGLAELNDPFKAIGADVNNDGKIRSSDLVELRKLILGVTDRFEHNTSWKFLDKSQTFADANSPWPIEEVMNITSIDADKADVSFVGQKIGDVNGDALSGLTEGQSDSRSKNVLNLWIDDATVAVQEFGSIDVIAPNNESLFGMQFTLSAPSLVIKSIKSELFELTEENYSFDRDGNIRVSVSAANPIKVKKGEAVFSIEYVSVKGGQLSDLIDISSQSIQAEAYNNAFEVADIQLAFRTQAPPAIHEFRVMQNEPNPFSDKSMVSFELPKTTVVDIEIFDVTGKVVYTQSSVYEKGLNRFEMHKGLFPQGGVYYCKIATQEASSTIKMIYLK